MAEFTGGDESKYLFAKIHENEDLATKKNKYQQAAKQNPYWLIYDILKFEEREMEVSMNSLRPCKTASRDCIKSPIRSLIATETSTTTSRKSRIWS